MTNTVTHQLLNYMSDGTIGHREWIASNAKYVDLERTVGQIVVRQYHTTAWTLRDTETGHETYIMSRRKR